MLHLGCLQHPWLEGSTHGCSSSPQIGSSPTRGVPPPSPTPRPSPILTPAPPCPVGAATPGGRAAGSRGAAGSRQPQTLLSRRPRMSRSWGGGCLQMVGGGVRAVPGPRGQDLPAWAGARKGKPVRPWLGTPELPGVSTGLRVCRVGYSGRCGKAGCPPPVRPRAANPMGGLLMMQPLPTPAPSSAPPPSKAPVLG